MGYYNNVKKQYLIQLFQSLIPAYVIERLFWQQRGMNVQMVIYCEIIYSVTIIALEIPSGILADRLGRKRLLVLSSALCAVEFLILLFADSFWMFGLAVFLSGIGSAFYSGSCNALLYDTMLTENRQSEFEKLVGRLSAVDFAGSIVAALSGSALASLFGFELTYLISVFSMAAAFLITLTLEEPPMRTKPETERIGLAQHTKQALSVFKAQPAALIFCMTGAVLGACMNYLDEFWQLALERIDVPVIFFGAVCSLLLLLRIPGNLVAHKLKARLRYKTILSAILLLNTACYFAVFLTKNMFCLIPMALASIAAGVAEPLITGFLHHKTESRIRATAESFKSLGLRALTMVVGLGFGYVSTKGSVFAGFALLGAVCAVYAGFFLCVKRRTEE